jgi:uncharacterized protein YndB with AHSA1/START domain
LGANSTTRRLGKAGTLVLALAALSARAENDPYRIRVRGLTDVPYPSYQGDRCTTIHAPKDVVWNILTDPAHAGEWLLTDLENVTPMSARFRKGTSLAKGEVLLLSVDTKQGPRTVELTVLVAVPDQLLALAVTKDDDVISPGAANLIYTFLLEEPEPGSTDLYWATHYDSDSPLAAAVSPLKGGKRRYLARAERGLLVLWGLGEAEEARLTSSPTPPPAPPRASSPTPKPTPKKRPRKKP